jgi:neutral ceramidase
LQPIKICGLFIIIKTFIKTGKMKNKLPAIKNYYFIFFFLMLLFGATISAKLTAQTPIKAGAAKVNITPPYGTIINGDFLPMYAMAIHDSLYAKALVFSNGKKRFAFVVVDNMTLDEAIINDAKTAIKKITGLQPAQVMISCTHAHSCGSVIEVATCAADLAYRLALPGKIATAVQHALYNVQPAKIAWGHVDVPKHVSCRRWFMKPGFTATSPFGDTDKVWMNPPIGSEFLDRPVSPTDPQVSYLAVKTINDKWISILANYSTHYVADIPENTISADYFGQIDMMLKTKLKAGDGFVGIMSNGTSGDVNTFDFKKEKNYPATPFEKNKFIANDITDTIILCLQKATWDSKPVFKTATAQILIATRKPSPQLLAKSVVLVKNTNFNTLNTTDKASDAIARLYAMEIVKLNYYQSDKLYLPLQAIRLGDGTIGTLPGEFFSETGLQLKKQAPCTYYFSISLANAMVGYVPPAAQFALGGYETWLCSGSHAEEHAEEKISAALIKLIRTVQ